MKNIHKLVPVLSILLLIMACKKKEITPSTSNGNPPFYFNGTINGSPTNIQAGVNNYYMFTSYALDGNGIYDLTGEFRNSGCTSNCPSSLKISIKDYRQYSIAPTTIDSSIMPGYYSYATPAGTATKFFVQFLDTLYNGTAQSYLWDFGDGTTSTQHKPGHLYGRPGVYNVSLNTQSTTSCSSSLTNDAMVGQVGEHVQLGFGGTPIGTSINFGSTTGGGTGPGTYTYNWNFGDGSAIATTTSPTISYTYSATGVYPVVLTRTDGNSTVEICRKNFPIPPVTTCYMNFLTGVVTPAPNPMNLAAVTIEWRDANGNLYTTYNNSQLSKSGFKVISVSDYHVNSNGQPTKIIHAKVTCTLYNGTSSYTLNGDLVFSVAHL